MARRSTKAQEIQRHDVGRQKAWVIQKARVFLRRGEGQQKAREIQRGDVGRQKTRESRKIRGYSSDVAKANKKRGNPAIIRRSTTQELEESTKIEGNRRAIDPGSNDAIDNVQFKAITRDRRRRSKMKFPTLIPLYLLFRSFRRIILYY